MRRLVDHVLCALPFEEEWFRRHGCNATFVGHPFFDEVRRHNYDEPFIAEHGGQLGPLVAILPGSRTQEVTNNLRWFLKAAAIIRQQVPNVRFALATFKPHQAEIARKMIAGAAGGQGGQSHFRGTKIGTVPKVGAAPPIEICVGKTPELMRLADCAMSVSGSVSLELLYHTTPTVILYWISRPAYVVQGFFRKVKYITLVNLLAADGLEEEGSGDANPKSQILNPKSDTALFPEYLTCEDKSQEIAGHIVQWLTDPASRAARVEALSALRARVAHGGASGRAAEYILQALRA
jgi:lipid-A-disaccharide synthase